jgi:dTDP-4-dehydrorhamnose 3,5-epimerase
MPVDPVTNQRTSCPPVLAATGSYPTHVQIHELSIRGAFEVVPQVHRDERGAFAEWFRADLFADRTGHSFTPAQANVSVSSAGALRGVHFADVPPGQAKYVTCLRGAVFDVTVDVRLGSPTFGSWAAVTLDDERRNAVYLSEGLGHAFMALDDDTVVSYLCSAPYAPERERTLHPLDPALGIVWPKAGSAGSELRPLLSARDQEAPTLTQAQEAGLLPDYTQVRALLGLPQSS